MKLWKSKKPISGCVPGKSAALKQDQQQQQQQDSHNNGSFNGQHLHSQHPPQTDSSGIALAPMLSGKSFFIFPTPPPTFPIPSRGAQHVRSHFPLFRLSAFRPRSGLSHFRPRCLRTALKCSNLDIELYTNIRRCICISVSADISWQTLGDTWVFHTKKIFFFNYFRNI